MNGINPRSFRVKWTAVPTVTSTSPLTGPYLISNNIRLTGKNFVAGNIIAKVGALTVKEIKWLSTTQIEYASDHIQQLTRQDSTSPHNPLVKWARNSLLLLVMMAVWYLGTTLHYAFTFDLL